MERIPVDPQAPARRDAVVHISLLRRESADTRIGIAGAGPAGLVAAIAATRLGFNATVFEQAPDFRYVGGGVGIQSNGMQVLDALGLLEPFRARLRLCTRAFLRVLPNRILTEADFSEIDIPHAGFSVVLRYELQSYLLDAALHAGVRLEFGAPVARVDMSNAGNAEVTLADGRTHACAIVIGSDGIRSRIRESAGLGGRIRAVGEAYLRCVAERRISDERHIGEYWANDGRRLGMFPLVGDRTYVFLSVLLGGWEEIRERRLTQWLDSWRDFGSEAHELVKAVPDWNAVNYDELKEVTLRRWSHPPVFLAGDAAHAMTPNLGQGANSAMVDALVLVRLLADARESSQKLDWVAERYDRVRRGFVTRLQSAARQGGSMAAWTAPYARTLRDSALRTVMALPALRKRALLMTAGYNAAEQRYLTPISA